MSLISCSAAGEANVPKESSRLGPVGNVGGPRVAAPYDGRGPQSDQPVVRNAM